MPILYFVLAAVVVVVDQVVKYLVRTSIPLHVHRIAHLRPLRRRELRRRVQQAHANRRVPRLVPLVLK